MSRSSSRTSLSPEDAGVVLSEPGVRVADVLHRHHMPVGAAGQENPVSTAMPPGWRARPTPTRSLPDSEQPSGAGTRTDTIRGGGRRPADGVSEGISAALTHSRTGLQTRRLPA